MRNALTADGFLLLGHRLENIEQLWPVIGRVCDGLACLGAETLNLCDLRRHPLEPVIALWKKKQLDMEPFKYYMLIIYYYI